MIFNQTGGMPLNFSVKGYASELLLPATAKENTIAVITSTPISGYQISIEEPENPVEGYAWISSGMASPTPISVTKKNPVLIYPSSAKQYVSGAWKDVTAKTYQNGQWMDWFAYLYYMGNEYTALTGGWTTIKGQNCGTYASLSKWESSMSVSFSSGTDLAYSESGIRTVNAIDVTNYTTLNANLTALSSGRAVHIGFTSVADNYGAGTLLGYKNATGIGELEYDVSSFTGKCYVVLICQSNGTTAFTVDKIWLE